MRRRSLLPSFLSFVALPLAAQGPVLRSHAPQPTSTAIDVRDLMTRSFILADDSMQGRDTGKEGGRRATDYIARELARLGLEPAGENGTFFQTIPWVHRRADSTARLVTGNDTLTAYADFLPVTRAGTLAFNNVRPFGGEFRGRDVPVIWGGRIGDSAMVAPEAVRGKVVVFAAPLNPGGQPVAAFWGRDDLRRYRDAAALFVAVGDAAFPQAVRTPQPTMDDPAAKVRLTVVLLTDRAASRLFGAPLGGLGAMTPGSAGRPVSGRADFTALPIEAPARNVVGILRGTDRRLAQEYVAVGAHHDHVGITPRPLDHDSVRAFNAVIRPRGANDPGRMPSEEEWGRIRTILDSLRRLHPVRLDSINNGADDDGSGSVLALEIAEAFAPKANRPARSLLFVFHAAEEKGLYGAQFFADHPSVPREAIVAQVNMDQMGRGDPEDAPRGGNDALVVIGSRRLSTTLGDIVEEVNRTRSDPFRLDYGFDQDGDPTNAYCRSDHYMYARYGIPVVFFSAAAWHRDYHMITDEPQYVAYPRMARVGNFIRDVVGRVAVRPARPPVDKPKPDPEGACRQ